MPARSEFFKRADFGRFLTGDRLLSAQITYNAEHRQERTSRLDVPHELPSKFLLRVRGEDRAAALAYLDQQEVLRQVFPPLRQNTLDTTDLCFDRPGVLRYADRSRLPARTATPRHSANGDCTHAKFFAACHD
jgi:hypothetical protein